MFVKFNYDDFPNVHATFGKLNSNNDFKILTNEWLKLYEQKKPFTFIFDSSNLEVSNIKYSFKMSAFIYRLKKMPVQYLQKSIMWMCRTRHASSSIIFIVTKISKIFNSYT